MRPDAAKKTCFVVCPIGADGSPTRERADQIFEFIIKPIVEELGYETMRSDHDPRPGRIGNQIIRHLVDDALVIADLTDYNPNVFYELAVRHMVKKPFVHLMQKGQPLPFDLHDNRTIVVDHTDLRSVAISKKQLKQQIQEVEGDPSLVDNPISESIDRAALEHSGKSTDRRYADILTRLDEFSERLNEVLVGQRFGPRPTSGVFAPAGNLAAMKVDRNEDFMMWFPEAWRKYEPTRKVTRDDIDMLEQAYVRLGSAGAEDYLTLMMQWQPKQVDSPPSE